MSDQNGDSPSFRVRMAQRSNAIAGSAAMHGQNPMQHGLVGFNILRRAHFNKGSAFSLQERQMLCLHGLLPPRVMAEDDQAARIMNGLRKRSSDLDRYTDLMDLLGRNEKLFYRVLCDHIQELMPIVYTPTVGKACQEYGNIFRQPKGLFITIHDLGHVESILANWPERDIKAICFTDGERILGLGDLGCDGMGIPVGKLALYTACAGIKPHNLLPVILDVGTDNEELLQDQFYIGLRQKRDRSDRYDALIREFIESVMDWFGPTTLLQFEDFGNRNAFRLLNDYRDVCCTFNDDIQGTASVALAGICASLKLTKKTLADNVFLFQGAGEAAIGIAMLIVAALKQEGVNEEDARKRIWLVDSRGLVVKNRAKGGIEGTHKVPFAHEHAYIETLQEAVEVLKPTCIVGVAAVPRAFTKEICETMAKNHERPIIFALSNPTSKAECTAEEAYSWTQGRCVYASGSPFKDVEYEGKRFVPGQGNNCYIFPGVALGIIACQARHVTDECFLVAAQSLAALVEECDLTLGRVYPCLDKIREVSTQIAIDVARLCYKNKLASALPEPDDLSSFIRSHQYTTDYENFVPDVYSWPNGKL
ncbi:NADP-dependent malic enzyme-like [Sycon ciliatum]|uniref:NADP-dependent malic enzyme-like n=1 Tax=Sycon ciliatum TaxID=27933 RepID=UPI0020ABF708|eukprot:scpid49115/ scgid19697/ NADP-dependent malic enzyme